MGYPVNDNGYKVITYKKTHTIISKKDDDYIPGYKETYNKKCL